MSSTVLVTTDEGISVVRPKNLVDLERNKVVHQVRGIKNPVLLRKILVETLADPKRRFSAVDFSKMYGVDVRQVKKWTHDPEINKAVRERIREIIGGGVYLSKLYKKITRQAISGSYKHQRLLFEIVGEYQPGMKLDHNVQTPETKFKELEQQRQLKIVNGTK